MSDSHDSLAGGVISRTRLEFLVDGIFAIAMTILVLELKVPELSEDRSAGALGAALWHEAPTFGSYLLSFCMLGVLWRRHNAQYRHVRRITTAVFALQLLQLSMAAAFPFCAALLGRHAGNPLSMVIYTSCVMVYLWSAFGILVAAHHAGAMDPALPSDDYVRMRSRSLRGCVVLSLAFLAYLVRLRMG